MPTDEPTREGRALTEPRREQGRAFGSYDPRLDGDGPMTAADEPTTGEREARVLAVVADRLGFVLDQEALDQWVADYNPDEGEWEDGAPDRVCVVTGSALPNGRSGTPRLPGSYQTLDVVYEHDVSADEPHEIIHRWEIAQLVAAGLNAWPLEATS